MSERYVHLIEKIDRQNSYSMKDKIEIEHLIRASNGATRTEVKKQGKLLKVIIVLQGMSLGLTSPDAFAVFMRLFL